MGNTSIITRLRLLWQKQPQRLSTLWHRQYSISPYMIDEPIEEELLPGDRLRYFHPTRPGEILDDRFKTIAKLGYGGSSTVWLAENLGFKKWEKPSLPRYVSIKITALDIDNTREIKISNLLFNPETSHEGLGFVRIPLDHFQLRGPEGTHSCLVYTPMRETLFKVQHRRAHQRLEPRLFKLIVYSLLLAIDYLHTECRLIHTDIKDDNILVTIEDIVVLTDFIEFQMKNPQPRHVRSGDGRTTYLSHGDFGPLRGFNLRPKLADFDLAFPGLPEGQKQGHICPIQSHCFRAPEVILGCPWSYSVDIWNLGLLMWNFLEDITLFGRPAGENVEYDAHVHLARMVSLLGDPPEELMKRERFSRNIQLKETFTNSRGKKCTNVNEFFGGPFFDDDNQILRKDLVGGKKLADTVTELAGDEKAQFLDLASGMLQWLPEKRKTAKELIEHPIFDDLNKMRAQHKRESRK
ncbi:kinase domain protein [Xylariaceae sp. FL0662B]|nr:kinase domain protein [Xylariaceae sp. FL0662B]